MAGYKKFGSLFVLGLLVLGGCRSGCSGGKNPYGLDFDIDQRSLSNGAKVIFIEDHTVPVISYQSWFGVGSVDEEEGYTGLAHLFEHLMFKGTEKYPNKKFFQELEAKGAEVNAYTGRDYTVYYENFTPNLLEKAIDMESDRLANLKLTKEDLDSEKRVVFEERRLRTDNSPSGKMSEALWDLAYRVHPYGWPVVGYPQDLLRADLKHVKGFFDTYYNVSNLTLVVVGDMDPDRTFSLIEKYYGSIKGIPRKKRQIEQEPEQDGERRLVLYDHVASEQVARGYHITAAEQPDSYSLDVLANILFEGTSSRMYRRLVEVEEMVLGVDGSSFTPTYPGLFMMSATMKGALPAKKAEDVMDDEIKKVQEVGVTQEEVDVAVRQLVLQLVDGVRTPYGLGQLIGTVHAILGDAEKYADDLGHYRKVTPEDVKRVAKKYLRPNNRTVITMKPESARDKKNRRKER